MVSLVTDVSKQIEGRGHQFSCGYEFHAASSFGEYSAAVFSHPQHSHIVTPQVSSLSSPTAAAEKFIIFSVYDYINNNKQAKASREFLLNDVGETLVKFPLWQGENFWKHLSNCQTWFLSSWEAFCFQIHTWIPLRLSAVAQKSRSAKFLCQFPLVAAPCQPNIQLFLILWVLFACFGSTCSFKYTMSSMLHQASELKCKIWLLWTIRILGSVI